MIEPTYKTLNSLFAERVFRIPRYQRFYDWGPKQREDLFSDIAQLADRSSDEHHFMATIVCYRTPEVKAVGANEYQLYDVVDGQQRLTTLIILLKAIAINLPEDKAEDRKELEGTLVKRDGNLILLQTNNANEHIFNTFIRRGELPADAELNINADKKLAAAFQECHDFVSEWISSGRDLLALLRIVRHRLGFVVYDTEDARAVYTLFEVLNSRGLSVDWLDKCKSMLMGRAYETSLSKEAASANLDRLQDLWANVYKELATVRVNGATVVRVAATLHEGPKRGKPQQSEAAIDALRRRCTGPETACDITKELRAVTNKLAQIDRDKSLGPATRVLHARILGVALMQTDSLSDHERANALEQWQRVTFRIFGLYGKDARNKVGEYLRIATGVLNSREGLKRYSDIMSALRELGREFPVIEAVNYGLWRRDLYAFDDEMCRYILWRYEEYLAGRIKGTVDENARAAIWQRRATDSIEHIYPQNPEPGGPWEGALVDESGSPLPKENIGRIGNLILLPQQLNESAKRSGFQKKKDVYARHHLRMIDEIREFDRWTINEIEEREKRLLEWAKTEWADVTT